MIFLSGIAFRTVSCSRDVVEDVILPEHRKIASVGVISLSSCNSGVGIKGLAAIEEDLLEGECRAD
jgi:hypothetical protein